MSKSGGKRVLINLRTIFSKHFITHEVKATGLKSFRSSADEDLGTGIMLDSLYVDGTLGVFTNDANQEGLVGGTQ